MHYKNEIFDQLEDLTRFLNENKIKPENIIKISLSPENEYTRNRWYLLYVQKYYI